MITWNAIYFDVRMPTYKHVGDSGMDIRAYFSDGKPYTLKKGEFAVIPTGLKAVLEEGTEIQIRSRSGLAAKHGVFVLNSPGTIDERYGDELLIIMANFGKEDFVINHQDRIAQIVFAEVYKPRIFNYRNRRYTLQQVTEDNTRNGGLGSSGVL